MTGLRRQCEVPVIMLCLLTIPACRTPYGHGNESAAVANLRTINTAEVTFLATEGRYGTIAELAAAGLLDNRFLGGTVSVYRFLIAVSEKEYTATATPISPNTGKFEFYTVKDGVVRYSIVAPLAPAGQAGAPVQ